MIRTTSEIRFVILGLIVVLTAGCSAQYEEGDSSKTPELAARELAALAVELGSYDQTLDRGAREAWDSSLPALKLQVGRELSDDEQARGLAVFRGVLAEFVTAELWSDTVTRVYADQFTATELEAIFRFYSSPAGRKMLEIEPELTREVDDVMEESLGGRLEEFITRIDEAIAEEFGGEAGS